MSNETFLQHIEAATKWPVFCRRHFISIFLNKNNWNLFHGGPIGDKSAFVQITAWRRTGDKPLPGPKTILAKITDCVTYRVTRALIQYKDAILPVWEISLWRSDNHIPAYLHNWISYTGKMTSLYWTSTHCKPQNITRCQIHVSHLLLSFVIVPYQVAMYMHLNDSRHFICFQLHKLITDYRNISQNKLVKVSYYGDRWIPLITGHLRGKCIHLMTSSSWLMALSQLGEQNLRAIIQSTHMLTDDCINILHDRSVVGVISNCINGNNKKN